MGKNKKNQNPLNHTMSLGDHLEELRARIILALIGLVIGLVVCLIWGRWIVKFIEGPYIKIMGRQATLQALSPTDGFICYMQIALVGGLILSSPWVFYQLWMFVAAGLYPHEKRYIYIAAPLTVVLFITGATFFIFAIGPIGLAFLIKFNQDFLGVASNFTFRNYVSFMALMMLVFGLAFQTPLVIFILDKTGIVSIDAIRRSRKLVILTVVIIAAVTTPGPDPFSQMALAIPLYALFELGILLCRFSRRKERLQNNQP
jgi:sec-independent protein translocase protein TatC